MKKLALFFSFFTSTTFAQDCGNAGFENGTTAGWTCAAGTFGMISPPGCDAVLPIVLASCTCMNEGGDNGTNEPLNAAQNRHTIMSDKTATDPNSNNVVRVVAPDNLFPSGVNRYSFRIGNALGSDYVNPLALSESIRFPFKVTTQNAGLTYLFSAFVNEVIPSHAINQSPRFEIKITDSTGNPINCGYYQVIAGQTNGFKEGLSTLTSVWKYTDWTKVALDLSGYIGSQLSIEFRTTDCYISDDEPNCDIWTAGSHASYAYIDMYCVPVEILSPTICANQPTVQLCAPPGYASYNWPANQPGIVPPLNQQCVTVNGPKAGDSYIVSMSSVAGGCTTTAKLALSGADFTIADTLTCTGTPITLALTPTTIGDYEWKWEPANNLSCSDCPAPIFTPGTTTTYTVTMSDKKVINCNRVRTIKVTVGEEFHVKTSDAEICEGEQILLTATGAIDYTWKDPSGLIYTGASINVNPSTTTTYTVTGTNAAANCPSSPVATATVMVGQKPIVVVTDIAICQGQIIQLDGAITGGTDKGVWVGGNGQFIPDRTALNAIYTPTPAEENTGKIVLTLESEDPVGACAKESKVLTIFIIPSVSVDAGPDQTICRGRSVTLTGGIKGNATSVIWSGGTGSFSPNANTATVIYTPSATEEATGKVVLVFTGNPQAACTTASDSISIIIDQLPKVSAGDWGGICEDQLIKLNGKVEGVASSGTWSGGTGIFTKNNKDLKGTYQPTPTEIKAGKVTLYLISDPAGVCPVDTSLVIFDIYPNPSVKFGGNNLQSCLPHCVDFVDSTTAGNTTIVKWLWNFGNGDSSIVSNPKSICYAKPGLYSVTLTATSDKGCKSTLQKPNYVETFANPVAEFTAYPNPVSSYDPTIYFSDQSTPDVKSWTWDLGDGTILTPNTKNPVHQYKIGSSGIHDVKLHVVNANGCVDSTIHAIEIQPEFTFYIPNAFTPSKVDGTFEGINDTFYGKGLGIVEYHIWIFDRWGSLLYDATDINKGWDGRVNNELVKQDVYVWKVQLTDCFGIEHNYVGTVTVVR